MCRIEAYRINTYRIELYNRARVFDVTLMEEGKKYEKKEEKERKKERKNK